ncbi:MAG: RluA family pseudouridine synthase [Terricaulis silvestris]
MSKNKRVKTFSLAEKVARESAPDEGRSNDQADDAFARPSPPPPSDRFAIGESKNAGSQATRWPQGRGGFDPRAFLIHEDPHVLAFNKPAGLAVQGGSGVTQSLEDMLAAFAKSNGKRPRLVHRLDRETSGVIIAARTKPAAAFLSEAFASREAKKTYLAIVCGGAPEPADGEIDAPLAKSNRAGLDIMEIAPPSHGQAALTRYRTLAATPEAALVELAPETGRMHQLRAHLAHIGRPIAGDGKYGGLYRLGATEIPGLMLHAAALDVPHPAGGRLQLSAPPPEAFERAAKSLGLEAALPRPTC